MVAPEIVTSVQKYLESLSKVDIPPAFGVIFGSHATGRTHEWSDIDLIVVSPRFDEKYTRKDVGNLWVTAGRLDNRIEPIPCGEREWEEDDSRAIVEIARREGVKVEMAATSL